MESKQEGSVALGFTLLAVIAVVIISGLYQVGQVLFSIFSAIVY